MRKLLLVGIAIFCVSIVHAQTDNYEVEETVIKSKEETYDNINYLEKNYGHVQPGEIIEIKPDVIQNTEEPEIQENTETPSATSTPVSESIETPSTASTPASESIERSASSRNITSSGSTSSSSARKTSSRKRSKRKINFKRKRPNKIKRKPKLGNRAACPRF